jgi:hypothetical protein
LFGGDGDDTLVRGLTREAVERGARLEADWDAGLTSVIDDLLQARSAGAASDVEAFDGASGGERFENRVNAGDDAHRWLW